MTIQNSIPNWNDGPPNVTLWDIAERSKLFSKIDFDNKQLVISDYDSVIKSFPFNCFTEDMIFETVYSIQALGQFKCFRKTINQIELIAANLELNLREN